MKFLVATILTAILAFITGLLSFSPWWGFAVTSFLIALLVHQKAGKAFLAGFIGLNLLWIGLSLFINIQNNGILSSKIASVLPLNGNTIWLIVITGFVGGLVSGMAAICGSYLRSSPVRR